MTDLLYIFLLHPEFLNQLISIWVSSWVFIQHAWPLPCMNPIYVADVTTCPVGGPVLNIRNQAQEIHGSVFLAVWSFSKVLVPCHELVWYISAVMKHNTISWQPRTRNDSNLLFSNGHTPNSAAKCKTICANLISCWYWPHNLGSNVDIIEVHFFFGSKVLLFTWLCNTYFRSQQAAADIYREGRGFCRAFRALGCISVEQGKHQFLLKPKFHVTWFWNYVGWFGFESCIAPVFHVVPTSWCLWPFLHWVFLR